MLKKATFLFLISLMVAGICYAGEKASEPSGPAKESSSIKGTVEQVDLKARTIMLKSGHDGKEKNEVYSFNDATSFRSGEESISAGDLKAGDSISIEADATNVATLVALEKKTMPEKKTTE